MSKVPLYHEWYASMVYLVGRRQFCGQQAISQQFCGGCRGSSLKRNHHPLRPYSTTMPGLLQWSQGGGALSYERGTTVLHACSTMTSVPQLRMFGPTAMNGYFRRNYRPCRSMAQIRQSRPDSGLGFQAKGMKTFRVVLYSHSRPCGGCCKGGSVS